MTTTRRTKLVCTIGPASAERIDALASAGMDVARINFAHGTPDAHGAAADAVRRAAAAVDRPLAILTDLGGPKIRLGELSDALVQLDAGDRFVLHVTPNGRPGDKSGAHVSYAAIAKDVRVGDPVFLADGAVELRVIDIADVVTTEVVRGGSVRSRAGVAIPATRLSAPVLTAKDLADIPRASSIGAAYVGQSFVRRADDVVELRRLLGPDGPGIIAKIETRPAVESFDAILDVVDGVMIARGDLGVELPYEEVPLIQKQLIRRALDRGVPSIVATQMLESMTSAPRPTRAEASDVANAVFDGADAIMLSGETAIGANPVLAAEAAVRIAVAAETGGAEYLPHGMSRQPETDADALADAAAAVVRGHRNIAAICCYTRTGRTARILSSMRPATPIVAFSPDAIVVQRLALAHGVTARQCAPLGDSERTEAMLRLLAETGLVAADRAVVLVSSTSTPGSAPNVVAIDRVAGPGTRRTGDERRKP